MPYNQRSVCMNIVDVCFVANTMNEHSSFEWSTFSHSVRVISMQLNAPWYTVSDVIVKEKCHWGTKAHYKAGRPKKLTDQDWQTLKSKELISQPKNHCKWLLWELGTDASERTTCQEVITLGFHAGVVAWKPFINTCQCSTSFGRVQITPLSDCEMMEEGPMEWRVTTWSGNPMDVSGPGEQCMPKYVVSTMKFEGVL